MKFFLILVAPFLLMTSASAHNPTESDSWTTIRNHFTNVVEVDEPSIKLDAGPLTSAFFVCVDGEQLRTIKKFTRCINGSTDDDGTSAICFEEEKYYGKAVIKGTREQCISWETVDSGDDTETICTDYQDTDYTIPLSHDVDVYKARSDDEIRGIKLFTKTLSIENCTS